MPARTKVEIRILPAVENLLLDIAVREFDGCVSCYVRELVYADLMKREVLDDITYKILKESDA